jgi:hypothetical protein
MTKLTVTTRIAWTTLVAVVTTGSAMSAAGREADQTAPSTLFCWQSLTPDVGTQDVRLALVPPALAAVGANEAWLSWQEDAPPEIVSWASGRWTSAPPVPPRDGFEGIYDPLVATSPSGNVFVVASANRDDGSSPLHVARAANGSWEWVGAPLISSREPFTHAHRASIAFLNGDRPVVAWSEKQEADPVGLYIASWDGTSWTRLGALDPDAEDTFLSPAIAVDANQHVWLAWSDARSQVRVARWNGSAWIDVGRDALQKLSATLGRAGRELSLAIDEENRAWVLWPAHAERPGARLALARWDGSTWTAVPTPRGPEGKDSIWSATMIVRGKVPLVAWSQADVSDNHYLFVSQWAPGDRWTARLSGLHLVEGISNVMDVRLAAGDAHSFFVAWDEPGKDERRTRLVRAYACASGETPAAPPKSVVERDTWPTTVDEAAKQIVGLLNDESKARVRATRKEQLIEFHSGWGMGIRNSLGLWRGNEKLLQSCGGGKPVHPDDCSMVIIEAVWTLLQAP